MGIFEEPIQIKLVLDHPEPVAKQCQIVVAGIAGGIFLEKFEGLQEEVVRRCWADDGLQEKHGNCSWSYCLEPLFV